MGYCLIRMESLMSLFTKPLSKTSLLTLCLGSSLGIYSVASAAEVASDPWEGVNRITYGFNKGVDLAVLRPLAKGYEFVTPDPIEKGVHNFFSNLADVGSLANNLLQLKGDASAHDFARIMLNTTFGLGGIFDVATPMGSPKSGEDFGQTLGYWGISSGSYIVLPLLGPSSVRDGIAKIPDSYTNVWGEVDHVPTRNVGYVVNVLDTRVGLFPLEKMISGDEYSFVRDAYLQQREFVVRDGRMDTEFNANDF
jgi:phospholipid-binding lipoprotein MlaA